jgi:hypothetical protein
LAGKTKNKEKKPISQNLVFQTPLLFLFLFPFFFALFSGGSCFSCRDSSVNCDREIAFALVRGGTGFAGSRSLREGWRSAKICHSHSAIRVWFVGERKKERKKGERIYGGGKWEEDDGVLAMLVEFASLSVSGICSYHCDYRLLGIA